MDVLKNLFNKKVTWEKNSQSKDEFVCISDGNTFRLKINDFPDEVMFTVSFENETIDFDDLPKKWSLEGM